MFNNQEIDFNFNNQDFNTTTQMNTNQNNYQTNPCFDNQNINLQGTTTPVCECPQERCCQRDIHHCVEHIVPINTRIINNHIYHHVYKPVYTCTEENICTNDNNCIC